MFALLLLLFAYELIDIIVLLVRQPNCLEGLCPPAVPYLNTMIVDNYCGYTIRLNK